MKNTVLILIGLFLFGSMLILQGCAGLSLLNPAGNHYNGSYNFMLDVNSNPSGAEIYLNNILVGRTPSRVPLLLKWEMNTWGLDFTQSVVEQYVLRVTKAGYQGAVEIIPVRSPITGVLWGEPPLVGLAKTSFHFNLVPDESTNTAQGK